MKAILSEKQYDLLFENEGVSLVNILTTTQLLDKIYDFENYGFKEPYSDKTKWKYFSKDEDRLDERSGFLWFCIFAKDKLASVAKVLQYEKTDMYELWYLDTNVDFQNKGHASTITEQIMKFCAKNNYKLRMSWYTEMGEKYLRPIFNRYAKKYAVHFIDRDENRDDIEKDYHL